MTDIEPASPNSKDSSHSGECEPLEPIQDDEEDLEGTQDQDLNSFVGTLLRPGRGRFEEVLAVELMLGINASDPLQKIRHSFEALFILEEEDQLKILTKEELEISRKLYNLTLSFSYMPEQISPYGGPHDPDPNRFLVIPLSFPKSEAYDYFSLFMPPTIFFYPPRSEKNIPQFEVLLPKLHEKPPNEDAWKEYYNHWLYPFLVVGRARIGTCVQLKSIFVTHTMPLALKVLKRIHNQFVSPETWQGVLGNVGNKVGSTR